METSTQNPVQAIQELIATHSTRIELAEKLLKKGLPGELNNKLESIRKQSHDFTSELMSELSQFGDAVSGSVDKSNLYQSKYKETLANIDEVDERESAELITSFEETLKTIYQQYADNTADEFKSLQSLIGRHLAAL